MRKNQRGFSVVAITFVIFVLGLIGAGGWYVLSNQASNKNPASSEDNKSSNKTSPKTDIQENNYLVIKEWGIKLKKDETLKNATYQVTTDNKIFKDIAYLSTKELDKVGSCNTGEIPTFQYIVRYNLSDKVSLDEGQTIITAEQASKQEPSSYKTVGRHVFYFGAKNGNPCEEANGSAVVGSYLKAFSAIEKL